ncbi:MAG TPA: hypothetical protein VIY51_13270, partial [Xanthobacteraceae bacterium]
MILKRDRRAGSAGPTLRAVAPSSSWPTIAASVAFTAVASSVAWAQTVNPGAIENEIQRQQQRL